MRWFRASITQSNFRQYLPIAKLLVASENCLLPASLLTVREIPLLDYCDEAVDIKESVEDRSRTERVDRLCVDLSLHRMDGLDLREFIAGNANL
jgi:hypothetical protein